MTDWRNTDPEGCVHRFEVDVPEQTMFRGPPLPATTKHVCRRFPPSPITVGGTLVIDRYPECQVRCGEFDTGDPEVLVIPQISPEAIAQFKRAWSGRSSPTILATGHQVERLERRPGHAYGERPAPAPPPSKDD